VRWDRARSVWGPLKGNNRAVAAVLPTGRWPKSPLRQLVNPTSFVQLRFRYDLAKLVLGETHIRMSELESIHVSPRLSLSKS
jgi:hypothetical protein